MYELQQIGCLWAPPYDFYSHKNFPVPIKIRFTLQHNGRTAGRMQRTFCQSSRFPIASVCNLHSASAFAGIPSDPASRRDTRSQIIESRSCTIPSYVAPFPTHPDPPPIPPFPPQPPKYIPPPPSAHFFSIIIIIMHHHRHRHRSNHIMISPRYSLAPSPLPLLAFGLAYLTELFALMLLMIAPGCSTGSFPALYSASLTHTEWKP